MKIYLRLEPPFEWVRTNARQVEAFGEVSNLDEYPLSENDEVIGVVPGEWVTSHQVTLPAKSKKQFSAALPYALEESISEDVENMHFVCPNWKANSACQVLVVSKVKMAQWQDLATQHRLPIDQLVPEHALIPFHDAADCSIALADEQVLANQRNGLGVSIDQDFLEVWMMSIPIASTIAVNDKDLTETLISDHPDRDFRHWPFGYKMAHWLEYQPDLKMDLWSERFRPNVRRFGLRAFLLPMAIIVMAVFSKFAFDTYRYIALHGEILAIQQEAQVIFKDTFPELGEVALGQEREFTEQAISRMGGADKSHSLQLMLAETAAVLRRQNVTISNMVYRDMELVITCQLSDFSQVDRLTKQLNARPRLTAVLQSSAADEGQIIASYALSQS
ncbi:MAG: general secretion pathway protein L [Cryomorphaceae bacterium]|jgi:general secretion pathway protein L